MSVLLITPPMVQVNAPYAATPVLAGFLRDEKIAFAQCDFSLALALRIFSADGLRTIRDALLARRNLPPTAKIFLAEFYAYARAIAPVVRFLQSHDPILAHRIASPAFLPNGWRFQQIHTPPDNAQEDLARLFGQCGVLDRATYLASLFLDEIADVVRDAIDPNFAFSRYAESLAESLPAIAPLLDALHTETLLTHWLDELTDAALSTHAPDLVALTCPFPGTLLAACRIARRVKALRPATRVVLGGGYPSTELRELNEPLIFDLFDAIVLDDGRAPLRALLNHDTPPNTFTRDTPFHPDNTPPPPPPRPDFTGLPLDDYLSLVEMPNPMHRLWSDGCWLKLPLTHGCHWGKCAFCDLSLPYIRHYAQPAARHIADHLFALHAETGKTGFHFTDEALSPALLNDLSAELLARDAPFTWWGNIRFERHFTPALARRMADAGCVAVTGGLECANDRLLKLMKKGVTLQHALNVLRALADAGILTHAYLIYAFPTQTPQDISDALEYIRRRFIEGALHSAFWHRFSLTAHSPMLANPEPFAILPRETPLPSPRFARNAIPYTETRPNPPDWSAIGEGLRRATYNYMLGIGLDTPVHTWFPNRMPAAKLPKDL